jgi:hypothetical protein
MNTDGLAKLYDRLNPQERLPLLLAAQARGDAREHRRLVDSAPSRLWRLPDHFRVEMALHVLTLIYVGEQLDHAAGYWHALWRLDGPDCPDAGVWRLAAAVNAYAFACNAEAWRRFCDGMHIDPAALTAANHHGWLLRYCEERMPGAAPTREEVADRLREFGVADPEPVTAEGLLAGWRDCFDACAGSGAGGRGSEGGGR